MKSSIKILALIACFPLAAVGESLQCGETLIDKGATQSEVAARCGQPTQIDHQAMYRAVATAMGMLPPLVVRSDTEIPIETWTYNFGPQRFMQRIRFENGVVVKIESLGYGF